MWSSSIRPSLHLVKATIRRWAVNKILKFLRILNKMLKVVNKTCIGDVELLAVDHEKLDLVGRRDICH